MSSKDKVENKSQQGQQASKQFHPSQEPLVPQQENSVPGKFNLRQEPLVPISLAAYTVGQRFTVVEAQKPESPLVSVEGLVPQGQEPEASPVGFGCLK